MDQQRNIILFAVISLGIMALFWVVLPHFFPTYFSSPELTAPPSSTTNPGASSTTGSNGQPSAPAAPATAPAAAFTPRPQALANGKRIAIHSDSLLGSISLTGGRVDDLQAAIGEEQVPAPGPPDGGPRPQQLVAARARAAVLDPLVQEPGSAADCLVDRERRVGGGVVADGHAGADPERGQPAPGRAGQRR